MPRGMAGLAGADTVARPAGVIICCDGPPTPRTGPCKPGAPAPIPAPAGTPRPAARPIPEPPAVPARGTRAIPSCTTVVYKYTGDHTDLYDNLTHTRYWSMHILFSTACSKTFNKSPTTAKD